MTRILRLSVVALAIALMCGSSYAGVRVILSPAGDGAGGVPALENLAPGQEIDLDVWVQFSDANQFVNGYSMDLYATDDGVVEAVSSTIVNSGYVFQAPPNQFPTGTSRWPAGGSTILEQPQLNTNGALLWNGAAGVVDGRGIDRVLGISSAAVGNLDPLYDAANGAFLVQTMTLRVLDNAAGRSTGLVMHVGGRAMGVDNATTPQEIFFGAGTTSVRSDAPGATDGTVHAMLSVEGGGRTDLFVFGGDPTGATDVPFPGSRRPTDVPVGGPAGKLNIDSQFQVDSFFDVFFDIEIDPSANTDLAGVVAMLEGQGLTVIPGVTLDTQPVPTDYDFGLRVAGSPGENLVMDFDFSANGLEGVSVNSVGVPEPSSFVLAALGCVALIGLRRRKNA